VLTFNAVQDGELPLSQTFMITNGGSGLLDWSISDGDTAWLDQNPMAGQSNSQEITVSVNTTGLDPGAYEATITVSSANAANSPQSITVTYTVEVPVAHIVLSTEAMTFTAVQNGELRGRDIKLDCLRRLDHMVR